MHSFIQFNENDHIPSPTKGGYLYFILLTVSDLLIVFIYVFMP